MVTRVDPFLIPIPRKILEDRESRVYFEYLNRFLHDLWTRTGGGNDDVAESQIGELYEPGIQVSNADELIEELEADFSIFNTGYNDSQERIDELELDSEMFFHQESEIPTSNLEIVVVTSDYTSESNQVVVVNSANPVVITANPTAEDGEFFHVVRYGTGLVSVQSAKLINGQPIKTIIRQYTAPKHLFIAELDTWNTI